MPKTRGDNQAQLPSRPAIFQRSVAGQGRDQENIGNEAGRRNRDRVPYRTQTKISADISRHPFEVAAETVIR